MSGMGMRKLRENRHNRVYHLISRIAHRAFYLDADERDRFIDVMKRSAAFSGVRLLAWCVMTNHVHVLVFVPEPEKLSDDDILARMRTLYRKSRFVELRDMLGIASRSYFTLHYLSPLAKAGYIELADGGNKSSCRGYYRLTRKGSEFAKWH